MKAYESATEIQLMPLLPIVARVDGRSFHTFTRGMNRPYDECMAKAMISTAQGLALETNACMVYTQSDEINLAWYSSDSKSQVWFNGRHSKMVSQLAAQATLLFNLACQKIMPKYATRLPTFDARVWQVPTLTEGANVFLWRELDATKNSISMAAQAVYSPKQLHGKNSKEKLDMLMEKGINWNKYPAFFKRGTYIQRKTTTRKFSAEELEKLPPKHEARSNPNLQVSRTEITTLELPPIKRIANREDVIFRGAEYILTAET